MWRRLILVTSSAVVLATWAICARIYATHGGGGYNGGVFATLITVAVLLTICAGAMVVRGWQGTGKVLAAAPVSALASASILLLAIAINSRG
jgi:hypothetical protein